MVKKKIFKSLMFLFVLLISTTLFANNELINKLKGKRYDILNPIDSAGYYYKFDTTGNGKWFFYEPNVDFLYIHETGKAEIKEGAKQYYPAKNYFKKITINGSKVVFGDLKDNINDELLEQIANHEYDILNPIDSAGYYYKFDTTGNGKWFFYEPNVDFLYIHETGKSKVSQGAKQYYPAKNYFNLIEINVTQICFDVKCEQPQPQCSKDNLTACTTQQDCQNAEGFWCGNKCVDNLTVCDNETACQNGGGYWCDGKCQAEECGGEQQLINFQIEKTDNLTGLAGGVIGFKAKVNLPEGFTCDNCTYKWDLDDDGKIDGSVGQNTVTGYFGNNEELKGKAVVYVMKEGKCVGKGEYEYDLAGDELGGTPPTTFDLVLYNEDSTEDAPQCK